MAVCGLAAGCFKPGVEVRSPSQRPGYGFGLDGGVPCAAASFATAVGYVVDNGPLSIVVGDFNGDGLADVAVAANGAATVDVLLNQANVTLAQRVGYQVASPLEAVAAGDFNGDGKLDLAVVGGSAVGILLNAGAGTFVAETTYAGTPSLF